MIDDSKYLDCNPKRTIIYTYNFNSTYKFTYGKYYRNCLFEKYVKMAIICKRCSKLTYF